MRTIRSMGVIRATLACTAGALLLTGSLAGPAPARAAELAIPVQEHELENGLRVLIHPDHDIPNVVTYLVWKVGSRNEHVGITGIAHFFEHMMFTGGAKYGSNFDPTMEAAGGSNNAYTSNDVTVYQNWFPKPALPLILDMEADRMSGMVFDPEVVKSEREVVASERRLSMEEPDEVMYEQLMAAAYTAHPYRWSVLGWMVDIENWKQSDLEEFFDRHYAPNNATLVVVGDVDPERVMGLVREKMGKLARKPERRPVHTQEPPQKGERRVDVETEAAGLGRVMASWHIVETNHPTFPVYEVLEALLFHGESSRMHRLLVEQEKVCLSAGGGWQGHQFDPSTFAMDLTVRDGRTTAEAEKLAYAELERLAKDGPTAKELRKVKNGLKAGFVRRLRTIDGKADLIAETDTFFGGWKNLGARLERIEAVTAEQVKEVVKTVLTKSNRTVCTLVRTTSEEDQ